MSGIMRVATSLIFTCCAVLFVIVGAHADLTAKYLENTGEPPECLEVTSPDGSCGHWAVGRYLLHDEKKGRNHHWVHQDQAGMVTIEKDEDGDQMWWLLRDVSMGGGGYPCQRHDGVNELPNACDYFATENSCVPSLCGVDEDEPSHLDDPALARAALSAQEEAEF